MKQPQGMRALLVVLCALIFPPLVAAKEGKREEAEALITGARKLSDIRCEGCPPFRLRAEVRLSHLFGKQVVEGTFEERWQSPNRWRTATRFPEFSHIRIGGENRVWSYGESPYTPYTIWLLYGMLGAGRDVTSGEELTVDKTFKKTIEGRRCACAVQVSKFGNKRTLCFASDRGLKLFEEWSYSILRSTTQYQDHVPFGDKSVPRLLRNFQDGKLLLEVHINDVTPDPDADSTLFSPPVGAESWPVCADAKRPEPIEKPEPSYTEDARRRRAQGRVVLFVVIGVDGRVHDVSALRADDPEFARVSAEAISQRWRFRPAMCGDKPIASVVFIETFFTLF